MLTLLAITVIAIGGPPGTKPHELASGNISVARGSTVMATTSAVGNLSLRLRPGTYTLAASLAGRSRPCEVKSVKLEHRARSIKLYCQIK